ncbi:O-antigen polymerase [Metabacillus herbersteinensis]|uniref:O-antigen polymerase n=1 Tax=Metabacillus herbersteinensis TaxID=283816 RepID=A0ABV6GFB0_9BACI
MVYLVIWIITLCLSTYMFRKVSGSLSLLRPNMISILFYYSLLLSSFIGALLIALNIDDNYMIARLSNQEYRYIGFYWICYIMLAMPLTMLMISNLFGFRADDEFKHYMKKPVNLLFNKSNDFFYLLFGLSVISLLSIGYMLVSLEQIPVIELFKGATNLGELRIEASHQFKGNVLIKNIFALGLTPILSLIAYIYTYVTNQKRWRILFILLFGASLFVSIYDLQKAPVFFYLLMFLLVNIYIGKVKLNFKLVLLIGTAAVAFIVILYIFVQNVTSATQFLSYNSGPLGRIILSQISPFYLHMDLFGQQIDFLNGKSLPNMVLNLYDLEQVRSARVVMGHYFPEKVEEGTAGVLNTLFAGEAFANFGYLGIFIGTLYLGVFIQVLYIIFIRLPKDPVVITIFVFFTVNIPRVVVGGFVDFLFNPFWLLITVLFLGSLLLIRIKNDLLSGFKEYLSKT